MEIYVVHPGDTLWSIASRYNTSMELIADINKLPNPNQLVVGQSMLIPAQAKYHTVKPGETLYRISQKYNLPLASFVEMNQIADPTLIKPGQRLLIPEKSRPVIDTGAYIDPRAVGARSVEVIDEVAEYLTYLNIFSYSVNRNGTLTPVIDQPLINAAYEDRAAPLMVITNFENGTFTTELATAVLSNESLQDQILDNALSIMKRKGYLGLDFDFEYLGAENRERYPKFLKKAAEKLKKEGYILSAALAPKLRENQMGVLYEGHDYEAIGKVVDFIFFMTYEWGWSGGPAMAVSPLNQVRRVMEYAISKVPKSKIMMGLPLYGYDWTLPYVRGRSWAKVISPQQAIVTAFNNGVSIEYDPIAEAPYYRYTDQSGRIHEVWFEDARSMQAKFDLVKELGIKGFYYWSLGLDFPQNWLLIEDNFIVRKRV